MLLALAVICSAAAAICSIRVFMSSTACADAEERLAGLLDHRGSVLGALGAILDDGYGLGGLGLHRCDQL